MTIELHDNGDYDVDFGKSNIQIETHTSLCPLEKESIMKLNHLLNSKIELKRHHSAEIFNSIYVEFETFFRFKNKMNPSGIVTSQADYWIFEMNGTILILSTDFLKWCYSNRNTLNLDTKTSGDYSHTSTGFIVPMDRIFPLQNEYKGWLGRRRAAEVYKHRQVKKLNT